MQYLTSINVDKEDSGHQSLLQQALKRKRTNSENENLLKRQFLITTAKTNNYFNNSTSSKSSLLSSALNSAPKTMSNSRPVFHLIASTNRSSSHVELVSLLKGNNSNITAATTATTAVMTSVSTSQIKSPVVINGEASEMTN